MRKGSGKKFFAWFLEIIAIIIIIGVPVWSLATGIPENLKMISNIALIVAGIISLIAVGVK